MAWDRSARSSGRSASSCARSRASASRRARPRSTSRTSSRGTSSSSSASTSSSASSTTRRGRLGHRDAARARCDRGGLEGLRDEWADDRRPGARVARAQARRHPGAEGGYLPGWRRASGSRLRAHRGRLGLGLGRDAHDRGARKRPVRPQRRQAVHHERGRREPLHGLCQDGSRGGPLGHLGIPGRGGYAGFAVARLEPKMGISGSTTGELDVRRLPRSPPATCSARRARASRSRCGSSTARGRASPRRRSGSRRARPTTRSSTRRRARRWASRSRSTS